MNPGDLNSKFDFVIGAGPQSDGRMPEKRVDRGDMVAAVMFVLSLLALALTYQTPAAGFARLALSAAMAMALTRFFTPVVARAALRCGGVQFVRSACREILVPLFPRGHPACAVDPQEPSNDRVSGTRPVPGAVRPSSRFWSFSRS